MTAEFFTIMTRYNKYRDNPRIRTTTQLQLESLLRRCPSQAVSARIASTLARLGRQPVNG